MLTWPAARNVSMARWHDGAPHQGQCEGCTTTPWHVKDAVYLNARGVSLAILTTARWDEVPPYVDSGAGAWHGKHSAFAAGDRSALPPGAAGQRCALVIE
jgi:hypothetical protein